MLIVSPDSVKYAIKKLENFVLLNEKKEEEVKVDALGLLCEALGLTDDAVVTLHRMCTERYDDNSSFIFVGALVGLGMAEHAMETND